MGKDGFLRHERFVKANRLRRSAVLTIPQLGLIPGVVALN